MKGAPKQENTIIVDSDEDEETSIPGKGKTIETLQEQIGKEIGVNLDQGTETDSVNLRIVKPRSSRDPFSTKFRLIGVSILTLWIIGGLFLVRSSAIYITIVAIPTLVILGAIIAKNQTKPRFESMIYIILIAFIAITGLGSRTSSGLEIYGGTVIIFLLLILYHMIRSPYLIVPIVLYTLWVIGFGFKIIPDSLL